MPNTGKSTLFNRLSGASARVGNWPGLTVELESARLLLGARMVELIDLPGMHNLHGFSEDEQVARHFLENQPLNALIVVLNATQIERQLGLALQLKRLGLPLILVLNMADEAARREVFIDRDALEQTLGQPVCLVSAKYGHGTPAVLAALESVLKTRPDAAEADRGEFGEDDRIEREASALLARVVRSPDMAGSTLTDRADRWLLHPTLGLLAFFLILLGLFQIVYGLGAPLQDILAE
jgi:ferrous iron transport protein B